MPTPGFFSRENTPDTPSVFCPSPSRTFNEHSTPLTQSQPGQLGFLDEAELDNGRTDDEQPSCLPYLIEWKVTLNKRVLAKDTEQDLVLEPSSYWQMIKQNAESVLCGKIARNRRVRSDDTTVVVSINERSKRDLTKRFERTDIDWTAINRQLLMWEKLRQDKNLRIAISINYIEDNNPPLSKRTDKRGTSSRTSRMLRELDDQIDAEDSSGQPSVWRDVYRKMRCPGPPCHHEGQYCWLDPVGKKHYKLRTHHMKALVKYVEQGGVIETHDDIPDTVRGQLYAEERQRIEKQYKGPNHPGTGSMIPQISINVHPAHSSQPVISSNDTKPSPSRTNRSDIDIPGLLEVAVEEYTDWHLSRVSTENYRENIRKARDVTSENSLSLRQIYDLIEPEFFVKEGMKIGVAYSFVSDITKWLKLREQTRDTEDSVD